MTPTIEAIIFDIGGVFVHVYRPEVFRAIEARLGLRAGVLASVLWRSDDWRLAEVGAISDEEYWRRTAPRLGLSTPEAVDELNAALFGDVRLDPDLVHLVRRLRGRYRTAMLSNASDAVGSDRWRARYAVDGLFDVEIVSARVGLAKPGEAIYRLALERLGVAPEAAVFIDDSPPNVAAASALGIHAIHFTGYQALVEALRQLGVVSDGENSP